MALVLCSNSPLLSSKQPYDSQIFLSLSSLSRTPISRTRRHHHHHHHRHRHSLIGFQCHASKNKEPGFMDSIIDYIEGGPKLRRWYGAPDLVPKDGGTEAEEVEPPDVEETRDAVLVTNGESEIGQMVILSLILKRARIKALVKNKRSAAEAFGTYVESMVGDVNDKTFLKKAMKGVRAIICPEEDGFFSEAVDIKGVEHIVLLSRLAVYRNSSGLQAMMSSNQRQLAERDEAAVIASGIPYTIIRTGSLQNAPGGEQGFDFKEGAAAKGRISKEDAAKICVEALDAVPPKALIFEVANGMEKVPDWKVWFAKQMKRTEEL